MLTNERIPQEQSENLFFPMSFAQQRLWFLEQLNSQGNVYNVPAFLLLVGKLDTKALTKGIETIISRHENLRVSIVTKNGKGYQYINPNVNFKVDYQDISNMLKKERNILFKEKLRLESNTSFDLSKAPLLRCSILRLAQHEHILSIIFHHIITDAWSMDIFFKELSELYNAQVENRSPRLSELPIQYIDFAVWQRKIFSNQLIKKQLDYWKKTLTGVPEISSLPNDFIRPKEVSYQGSVHRCNISLEILHSILKLARQYNVTLFMILITVYQFLLHRFANQEVITVGTPILNRHYPKVENLIGFFVNTLAIRLDCKDDISFIELLLKNRDNILSASENQDVPFEHVVDYLKVKRDLGRHPIFQTWFVLENKTETPFQFKDIAVENIEMDDPIAKFDLALWVKETSNNLLLRFEYSTDLFQEDIIKQFATSFELVLKFLGQNPQAKIGEIPIVSEEFRQKAIIKWNNNSKLENKEIKAILEIIEDKADEVPNNIALKLGSEQLSYRELMTQVNQLVWLLKPYLPTKQSRIALAFPRGFDGIIAALASLKLGAAYVPLDLNWPEARIKYILKDSEINLILTHQKYMSLFASQSAQVLLLDELRSKWYSMKDSLYPVSVQPEDTAYIIYTSGSTGQPKGVLVTHRGIANLALTQAQLFEIDERSRILQFASLSFDAAVSEWSTSLSQGACLCLLAEKSGKLTEDLIEIFKEESITVVTLPPSVARALPIGAASSLKTLVLAGEASNQALIDKWIGHVKLINAYGPTETTVCATAHVYQAGDAASLIGKPLANVQAYLMNSANQLTPPGVIGEIVVGGIGVAQGYLNREALTAERFIADFITKGEKRYLYRTGDLGRYRVDGAIEYVGRIDNQIKLRGYRIELGEIEQTLLTHPDIEEAVVLLKEIKPGQKALLAYIQLKEDKKPGTLSLYKEKLSSYLQERIPGYMIPEKWLLMDEWPLTVSGKIDRQHLLMLEPETEVESTIEKDDEPSTEIEKLIAGLWSKLLRLERVGLHDDFFRIGGDSITAIQFVSKAKQVGLKLTVQQIFNAPTIMELKNLVQITELYQNKSKILDISQKLTEKGEAPLSPSQLWLFDQKLINFNHFNQAVILQSEEDLDPECLEKALQSLIQTHSSLRLRFRQEVSGEWKQQYEPYESLKEYSQGICRIESLEALAEEDIQEKRLSLMNEVQQSLNIIKGPVFQGILFKGQEKDNLFLVCHHLMIDSVSWRILLEDLEKAYKEIHQSGVASLAPEGKSYSWWTHRLIDLVQEQSWKEELGYWEKVLADSQSVLPQWIANEEANTVASLSEVTFELSVRETQQLLQEVPRAYKTQINDVLLTALGFAIKEWTGLDDISLMLEGHGREQLTEEMDLSRTIGWFTSIYPVSFSLAGVEGLGDGIKLIKESLRAIPKKGIGYGMLRYLTSEGRERLSNKKEPELSFNYLGQWDNSKEEEALFQFSEEYTGTQHHLENSRRFAVEINARIIKGVFQASIAYSKNIYQESKIEALAASFIKQLLRIITHCCFEELDILYTPSDFPLCGLGQVALNLISKKIPPIEDLYPLSPMQSGLLATSIRSKDEDPYLRQNLFELTGDVKCELVKQAWQSVTNNEPVLRTGFIWDNIEKPLQFVLENMPINWIEDDWQAISENQYPTKIQELLNTDSKIGFDLKAPPLLRFYLIKLNPKRYFLLWTIHHILIDGWCSSILIQKFLMAYEALELKKSVALPQGKPYRDYIQWLQNQDLQVAENFWKTYLNGVEPLTLSNKNIKTNNNSSRYEHFHFELNNEKSKLLKDLAGRMQITLSNIIQVVWAVLINGYTQQKDVTFGITVSGRAVDITGIDEMIGVFINTLPLRVKISPERDIMDILHEIRKNTLLIQQYAYVPLSKIHSWAGLNGSNLLFDHLFIFENYPVEQKLIEKRGGMSIRFMPSLSMEGPSMHEQTEFPLVLGVTPKETILFSMSYNQMFFTIKDIMQLASHLENVLDGFIDHANKL